LALVVILGLGALFLSFSEEYAPAVYSLLFGEVLGISSNDIAPTAILGLLCIVSSEGQEQQQPDRTFRDGLL
jgi:zinc/manganese transport system permease protein